MIMKMNMMTDDDNNGHWRRRRRRHKFKKKKKKKKKKELIERFPESQSALQLNLKKKIQCENIQAYKTHEN